MLQMAKRACIYLPQSRDTETPKMAKIWGSLLDCILNFAHFCLEPIFGFILGVPKHFYWIW